MISWYIDSSCIVSSKTPRRDPMFHRSDPEELLRVPYTFGELVDLGVRVVHVEAGAVGRLAAQCPVQRPRAVVPRPDGDAQLVEHLADVVRVHAFHLESDGAAAILGGHRPDDPDAGDLAECAE